MILDAHHPLSSGLTADSRLIQAYQGVRPDVTPVWFITA
jgi:uroporphyrinogen decarboxylase